MKLLLDENLSRRLVPALREAFPGSQHQQYLGLQGEADATVWAFAGREGYALVSTDDDFRQISLLRGAPPKVLVLAIGNGANAAVLKLPMGHRARIEAFGANPQDSLLVLRDTKG